MYLELKKKLCGVVYKRAAVLPYAQARAAAAGAHICGTDPETEQTLREISCFLGRYPVSEKAYISYDRTAFTGAEDPQLRVTFDRNIRFRQQQLSLNSGMWGRARAGSPAGFCWRSRWRPPFRYGSAMS